MENFQKDDRSTTLEESKWFERLKFKNVVLITSIALSFFACIYAFNIHPSAYSGMPEWGIDFAFFTALRFTLTLLVLLIPFKSFGLKILASIVAFFVLGFVIPLVPLSDAEGLIYILYFILTFIVILVFHLLINSRFALPTGTAYLFSFIITVSAIGLLYASISWTKSVAEAYTKDYAYNYVRCNAETLKPESIDTICSNLIGRFWQDGDQSYQDICYAIGKDVKDGKAVKNACDGQYDAPQHKHSNFLMDYFNTKSKIGLPLNS